MQKILLILILILGPYANAQNSTGIYKFRIRVDKRMTNRTIVNNNGAQNKLFFSRQLQDSVLTKVQGIVQRELLSNTRLIYPVNKKGNELKTGSSSETIGGLPRGTKRQAMKVEYLEYYVKFKINVGLNKTMSVGNQQLNYSRLKPYVRVKMKAYGVDRRVKRRKKVRLGGFKSIGSFEYKVGTTTVVNTNALPIEEVLDMIFKGLDKFEKKVKY